MKKILKNNLKTRAYLDSLPKIYITGRWAHWGILEFPFSGKFEVVHNNITGKDEYHPLVWNYYDYNGLADQYQLVDIFHTTTGAIYDWSFFKRSAELLAETLEYKDNNTYTSI